MYRSEGFTPLLQFRPNPTDQIHVGWTKQLRIFREFPNDHHVVRLPEGTSSSQAILQMAQFAPMNNRGFGVILEPALSRNLRQFEDPSTQILLQKPMFSIYKTYPMSNQNALHRLRWDALLFPSLGVRLKARICDDSADANERYDREPYREAVTFVLENKQLFDQVIFSTHDKTLFEKIASERSESIYHASQYGRDAPFRNKGTIRKMIVLPFEDTDFWDHSELLYRSRNNMYCNMSHESHEGCCCGYA